MRRGREREVGRKKVKLWGEREKTERAEDDEREKA